MKRWSDDQRILTALEKLGGNASAAELSDYIARTMRGKDGTPKHIPARTIRYRLSTLIERGILLPSYLESDERKVGLGEGILLLQENLESGLLLDGLLDKIPIFHWYVPTNGKYDGYLVHVAYDLSMPEMMDKMIAAMKRKGVIDSSMFFDIVDYDSKRVDFTRYKPSTGWSCKWSEWKKNIEQNIEQKANSPFNLIDSHDIIEYDYKDILILRALREDPETSMTSLSSITKLPLTGVRERIHKLRKMGVIKGSSRAYGFSGDLLWFSLFMCVKDNEGAILKSIHDLPFPGVVLMMDTHNYCVRFGLTTSDLKQFMDGVRLFRPHLESYFFQFHLPDRVESKYPEIFNFYNSEEDRWDIPVDDYLKTIEQYGK